MTDPPPTSIGELDETCTGTESGKSCLSMDFAATSDLRNNKAPRLKGAVYWALYHDGDVNGFGPKGDPFMEGHDEGKDISTDPPAFSLSLPNIPTGHYQVLAYVDSNGNGSADKGECVTKPAKGFPVPEDKQTRVFIEFNATKPF